MPQDIAYITNVRAIYVVADSDVKLKTKLSKCGCRQYTPFIKLDSGYKKYIQDIKYISEDKWASRVTSRIVKKDAYLPHGNGFEFSFKIRPTQIRIEYLKVPSNT